MLKYARNPYSGLGTPKGKPKYIDCPLVAGYITMCDSCFKNTKFGILTLTDRSSLTVISDYHHINIIVVIRHKHL